MNINKNAKILLLKRNIYCWWGFVKSILQSSFFYPYSNVLQLLFQFRISQSSQPFVHIKINPPIQVIAQVSALCNSHFSHPSAFIILHSSSLCFPKLMFRHQNSTSRRFTTLSLRANFAAYKTYSRSYTCRCTSSRQQGLTSVLSVVFTRPLSSALSSTSSVYNQTHVDFVNPLWNREYYNRKVCLCSVRFPITRG